MGTQSVLADVSIHIESSDKIGLVGHNGSGKSTLLAILAGALDPDEGEISRSRELHLEQIEQFMDPLLNRHSLFEALAEKLPAEERAYHEFKVTRTLESLGFARSECSVPVADLSGGQQNRLMFARAVINEPNLVLFDEPTNHLDLQTIVQFEGQLI